MTVLIRKMYWTHWTARLTDLFPPRQELVNEIPLPQHVLVGLAAEDALVREVVSSIGKSHVVAGNFRAETLASYGTVKGI